MQGLWERFLEEVGFQFCFAGGKRSCISNVGRKRVPDNRDLMFSKSLVNTFELRTNISLSTHKPQRNEKQTNITFVFQVVYVFGLVIDRHIITFVEQLLRVSRINTRNNKQRQNNTDQIRPGTLIQAKTSEQNHTLESIPRRCTQARPIQTFSARRNNCAYFRFAERGGLISFEKLSANNQFTIHSVLSQK